MMNAYARWLTRAVQLVALLVWTGAAWAQGGQGAHISTGDSGRDMLATFTAPKGYTLTTWAEHKGFIGFDWQQWITSWPNPDIQCYDCGHPIVPVSQNSPPFLDPYQGGYTYNPCGGMPIPGASGMAYPFYYTPKGTGTDCWLLSNNETSTKLSFGDEPMDPELTSTQISQDDVPMFMTALVGIEPNGDPSSPLFFWTWETTYTGSVGGTARTANIVNGTGGTGGITILTINGQPVPEPPGLSLLIPGTLAILAANWSVRRRRRASKAI